MRKLVALIFLLLAGSVHGQIQDASQKLKVVVFLAVDCPISQDYMGKLNDLAAEFRDQGVSVIGVLPTKIKKKDLHQFAREYEAVFPIQMDKKKTYLRTFRPAITPEVFLVDANSKVLYHGAIDDWYYELGRHRQQTTDHYLVNAIRKALNGLPADPRETKAIGCQINLKMLLKEDHQ